MICTFAQVFARVPSLSSAIFGRRFNLFVSERSIALHTNYIGRFITGSLIASELKTIFCSSNLRPAATAVRNAEKNHTIYPPLCFSFDFRKEKTQ